MFSTPVLFSLFCAAWPLITLFAPPFSWFLFSFLFTQCTQRTKDVLERVVHSSDFPDLCSPGTPKTTPQVLEVSNSAAPITKPSPSVCCAQQRARRPAATTCPQFGRRHKRDSLHSINPAFRLASPSPTLSRTTLMLGDAPDTGFNPLHWVHPATFREMERTRSAALLGAGSAVNSFIVAIMMHVASCFVEMSLWGVD